MTTDRTHIHILPEDLCNKIAAGEVIQRPASVVKELIENSLDAGADEITVDLENGGRDLIRITDNGQGMGEDDLLMAFERHATSKIRSFSDLDSIRSMGFRGEALASIGSVSRVECITATEDGNGQRLLLDGGRISDLQPRSSARGSMFCIRNLFFNVPARKKFLKSENAEYRHCLDYVRRFALIHDHVNFTLNHNGKEIFRIREKDSLSRLRALLGARTADRALFFEHESPQLRVRGFLGLPELSRRQVSDQFISVNRRIVNDRRLNAVIYSAYSDYLERGEYPFFVLDIGLDPKDLDVNVHPAKTEVKFRYEYGLFESLKNLIHSALRSHLQGGAVHSAGGPLQSPVDDRESSVSDPSLVRPAQRPFFRARQQDLKSSFFRSDPHSLHPYNPRNDVRSELQPDPSGKGEQLNAGSGQEAGTLDLERRLSLFENSLDTGNGPGAGSEDRRPLLWQAHGRYIFAQVSSGVVVVDQHLAHSRILFDRALKVLEQEKSQGQGQQLLFPLTLEFNAHDFSHLLEIIGGLEKLGFGLRVFGKHSIIVDAVPVEARHMDEGRLLQTILDEYKAFSSKKNPLHHSLALAYSDRAAIRSGESLSPAEMQNLIDNLFSSSNPYFCPRGKTVITSFSLKELGSRFS